MRSSIVNQRLSSDFHRLLSREIHLSQAQLPVNISLTRVELSPDLHQAHVFYFSATNINLTELKIHLKNLTPHWKKNLARRWKGRRLPQIFFHYDNQVEKTGKLARIFEKIKSQ